MTLLAVLFFLVTLASGLVLNFSIPTEHPYPLCKCLNNNTTCTDEDAGPQEICEGELTLSAYIKALLIKLDLFLAVANGYCDPCSSDICHTHQEFDVLSCWWWNCTWSPPSPDANGVPAEYIAALTVMTLVTVAACSFAAAMCTERGRTVLTACFGSTRQGLTDCLAGCGRGCTTCFDSTRQRLTDCCGRCWACIRRDAADAFFEPVPEEENAIERNDDLESVYFGSRSVLG